jgi:hypothetical protein
MALSFQIAHPDFCRKSRTPPFTQTNGPEQILTTKVTTKSPFRGCPRLKFQASLAFHKTSSYAAFEKRPPCPCPDRLIMGGKACPPYVWRACPPCVWRACPPCVWRGMGLFERPHLADQTPSASIAGFELHGANFNSNSIPGIAISVHAMKKLSQPRFFAK